MGVGTKSLVYPTRRTDNRPISIVIAEPEAENVRSKYVMAAVHAVKAGSVNTGDRMIPVISLVIDPLLDVINGPLTV